MRVKKMIQKTKWILTLSSKGALEKLLVSAGTENPFVSYVIVLLKCVRIPSLVAVSVFSCGHSMIRAQKDQLDAQPDATRLS